MILRGLLCGMLWLVTLTVSRSMMMFDWIAKIVENSTAKENSIFSFVMPVKTTNFLNAEGAM
jgi:hypothetical protein